MILISVNNFCITFVQQCICQWKGESILRSLACSHLLPIKVKLSSKSITILLLRKIIFGQIVLFIIEFIIFQKRGLFCSLQQQQIELNQKQKSVMDDSEDNQIQKQAQIYKRQKLLGSGSYGRAFLVREIATDVQWVVKQINLSDLMPNEQNQAMKEAKILELLEHPNIIRFKEVYRTTKGKLNIVMQYAQNGDLAQSLKKAKQTGTHFSEQTILNWFVQMCIAMKHIHQRKIIHRDLKPQNIFLDANDMIKIGDFGVARVMENTIAKARTVVGSPYYLSPEIIENRPYSYKTDIWSMGTLLFELCSLEPPFKANNLQFLALKIVQGSYAQIPRQYSQGLRMLIKSMLQTKEANRPNISQILSSRIVSERMNKFIADQKQKLNDLKNIKQPSQTMSYFNMGQLKSPPNLMNLQMGQNKSQIIMSKNMVDHQELHSPAVIKAKTPQIIIRKGPNNFLHRPPSSKRKIQPNNQLADLIHIKPSIIETHEKVQKCNLGIFLGLPKVPKAPKPVKIPKEIINPPLKQLQKQQIKNPPKPSSAFTKKRTSFTSIQQRNVKKPEIKEQKLQVVNNLNGKKDNVIRIKVEKKGQKMNEKPNQKGLGSKKTSIKSLKSPNSSNLEIISQEAKKKIITQRKNEKKVEKPKKKVIKHPQAPKPTQPLQQKQQTMQQQKCNNEQDLNFNSSSNNYNYFQHDQQDNSNIDEYYDNESFQSYEQRSQKSQPSEELDLELSASIAPNKIDNYHKMLEEIDKINKIVHRFQGRNQDLPMFGDEIPEIFNFTDQMREDDSQLQSAKSIEPLEQSQQIITPKTQELQNLRMNLQQILGLDNVIYAYHTISKQIELHGLDLDEETTIQLIIEGRPQIDQTGIRNYFRLIVTIITIQNKHS